MEQIGNLLVSGLSTGSVYALVALGFNVVFKSTGAINFAQGEWVMMGGMVAATAYAAQLPLALAVLCALLVVVAIGLLSEWLVVRRLARPTPLSVTLILIAVAICSKSLVMLVLGKNDADADEIEEILDDETIDVIVGSQSCDIMQLLEDDALLALPQAPKHEVCPDTKLMDSLKLDKVSPFAALKGLKSE